MLTQQTTASSHMYCLLLGTSVGMYGGALFTMLLISFILVKLFPIFVSILIKLKNNLCPVWQVVDSYNKEKLSYLIFFNMYVEKFFMLYILFLQWLVAIWWSVK